MRSEKEKMLNGDLYLAFGDELLEERQHAKDVIFEYNSLNPREIERRNELLRGLFKNRPKNFFIEPPFRCDYGYNIHFGENSYANYNLVVLDCAEVFIGENVLMGPNVSLFAAGHPVDSELRNVKGVEYAFPIKIGDNAWLGGGTIVNAGVTIGENTVIASGSVVTKNIPSNVVAGGNPCKVIREITDEDKRRYFKGKYI
ncbi:sugar O-acetyltransferase [Clostridium sp.]|uniref:sugar O-acetyltransferase n=1 Tax=Clostridium sp. TaxID=1506 RepID=UPI002FCC4E62